MSPADPGEPPPTADAALRLAGVAKRLGGKPVLRGLDLSVGAGAAVALQGANGSGKSTTLRIAAGLVRPDAGTVHVAGHDTRRAGEAARRRMSLLTQDAPLYGELTPHEHLRWWMRAQGHAMAPAEATARLASAGLARQADQPCRSLSRGQRQRAALAMALALDRPLLLLDEPFAALDADGAAWLAQELADRRGRQAVVLAHHGDVPGWRPDRIVCIDSGKALEAAA